MGISKIIGIVLFSVSIIGLLAGLNSGSEMSEVLPPSIIFALIGAFFFFKKPKTKEDKLRLKQQNIEKKEYDKKHFNLEHKAGLPIPENSICSITYDLDKFIFSNASVDFKLPFNKVTSIDIKTDVEISKQFVSSVGGAVGGAVLFGPLGAMIGGRAKEKKSKEIQQFVIFTYVKDDKIEYISFEIPKDFSVTNKVGVMKDYYDSQHKTNAVTSVEL